MNATALAKVKAYVEEVAKNGEAVLVSQRAGQIGTIVDRQKLNAFQAECKNVVRLLGAAGKSYESSFENPKNDRYLWTAEGMLGTLRGIQKAIAAGMIGRIEDMVLADALGDLLEQAEELQAKGYHVAAGVLGRAVLEEHLRKLCDANGCAPVKQRPTMTDYTLALYNAQHLNKIGMKQVEALAAVGNDAAHAKPLEASDVRRMIAELPGFIEAHPLS